jgi:signal transduction histidine kinase
LESWLQIIRVIFTGLVGAQVVILCIRFPTSSARSELLLFCAFIAFLGLRLILPRESYLAPLVAIPMIWAAGDYFLTASGKKGSIAWGACNAFFLAIFVVTSAGAYRASVPLAAFRVFFIGTLGFFAVVGVFRLAYNRRSASLGLAAGFGALLLATAIAETLLTLAYGTLIDLGIWPGCLLACCTGYMLFQQGYFKKGGWRGMEELLDARERLMRDTYARLLRTENALVLQNRLIVSGLIAAGAAHEFKNALAHIKATSEAGLARSGVEAKDESLRLLSEHAEVGARAAVEYLERTAREGREEPAAIDLEAILHRFHRMVRSTFRPEGVIFDVALEPGLKAQARRYEVEQVVLNLVRNSVEAFRRGGGAGEKRIEIVSRRLSTEACIEVSDNAGGMPPAEAAHLFDAIGMERGSSGLGLYLSRSLAERNGGSLSYIPLEAGSRFRLMLPLAD